MANTLGVYNPTFYAQEALINLEKALGMAGRVHRGIQEERNAFGKGETINIRRPSTFTAENAPATAQDVTTETVAMTLSNWKEVKFKLTDKELAFTGERIIEDHIRPAAYALADNIDQALAALYVDVPWFYDLNASPGSVVSDVTEVYKVMFDNSVPMNEEFLHYMVNGTLQAGLTANSAFAQWQGAGPTGEQTQLRGSMGRRYGMNFFANQNVQSHTKGTFSATTPLTNGTAAAGATSVTIDDVTLTGTIVAGDILSFANHSQQYVASATATASGNAITVSISPALQTAVGDGVAVTYSGLTASENLAFHRNAFALAMAPLSELGAQLGARISMVQDPVTNLAIRSRLYYVGNSSEVHVALDVLYGVKTLDEQLAVRARD